MLRTLSILALLATLTAGCANGWPRVRNAPKTAHINCVPTGSKIDRADCGTSNPGSSTSQTDLDRTQSDSNMGQRSSFQAPR